MISDPALPLLPDLLGEQTATDLLCEVVGDDTRIIDLRIVGVSHRRGRRATVRYAVRMEHGDGRTEEGAFTAWTGKRIPDGGIRVSAGGDEVGLWRFPDDPRLPGLAVAMTPTLLAPVLGEIGMDELPIVALRAYRPGRRAVVEVVSGPHKVFVKVVRPSRVAELQEAHTALATVVPVPRSHGWSSDMGLVVLEPLPGQTLSSLLRTARPEFVPSPEDLSGLLDLIAAIDLTGRHRTPSLDRTQDHAESLIALLPDLGGVLDDVIAASIDAPRATPMTAHRDFHAGQLIVSGASMGLVDIDTVGRGTREDDYGMFLAQLVCLARPGAAAAAIREYTRLLADEWIAEVGRAALLPRVAASLLGFASGPFRTQEPGWETETRRRVEAAASWVIG